MRNGEDGATDRVEKVRGQLAALLGVKAAPAEAAPPAVAPAAPEAAAVAEAEPESVTVRLAPRPGFLLAGFDPARIIRAARPYGLISTAVEGKVPPIEDYAPGDCPLAWRLEFELEGPLEALEDFFSTYAYGADIVVTTDAGEQALAPKVGEIDAPAPLKDPVPAPEAADVAAGGPAARPVVEAAREAAPAVAAATPAAAVAAPEARFSCGSCSYCSGAEEGGGGRGGAAVVARRSRPGGPARQSRRRGAHRAGRGGAGRRGIRRGRDGRHPAAGRDARRARRASCRKA